MAKVQEPPGELHDVTIVLAVNPVPVGVGPTPCRL